jgi:hypothetical protein
MKDSCASRFLAQAHWDAGPLGGGGRLILNHLLHAAGLRPRSFDASPLIKVQAERLRAREIDVAFCFAGDVNNVFDAVKATQGDGNADPLGISGVDPQLGIAVESIELRPTSFKIGSTSRSKRGSKGSVETEREVETLGAYAVLVASSDVPAGDAAVLVQAIVPFVRKITGTGTHLNNVADALKSRSDTLRAHLFGVAGQFAVITLTCGLLCGTGVSAFASRRSRRRIMQEHSRLLQDIGLGPTVVVGRHRRGRAQARAQPPWNGGVATGGDPTASAPSAVDELEPTLVVTGARCGTLRGEAIDSIEVGVAQANFGGCHVLF